MSTTTQSSISRAESRYHSLLQPFISSHHHPHQPHRPYSHPHHPRHRHSPDFISPSLPRLVPLLDIARPVLRHDRKVRLPSPFLLRVDLTNIIVPHHRCTNLRQLDLCNVLARTRSVAHSPLCQQQEQRLALSLQPSPTQTQPTQHTGVKLAGIKNFSNFAESFPSHLSGLNSLASSPQISLEW